MLEFYVYILECKDGSYYTGQTDNIEARISMHKQGLITTCYTYTRLPVKVVHVSTFASRAEAIGAEQQIKGWSRKKKEAFIKENFDLLQKLSNAKNNAKNKLKL
ncbi:MAG: excinuclease ABC subunit C [candidate division TM6 bacterium GW2011_GWF2_30_66]|nr:MAG: excinuclease ABC subunit C [candidate division TM6 bacterium GW2011_GWF2_30_66]